jgi:DNA-binding CsgD family transcriptional regulator
MTPRNRTGDESRRERYRLRLAPAGSGFKLRFGECQDLGEEPVGTMATQTFENAIARVYSAASQPSRGRFPCDLLGQLLAPAKAELRCQTQDDDIASHRLRATMLDEPAGRHVLTATRAANRPGFTQSETRLFQLLIPHLCQAMRIRAQLRRSEQSWRRACAVLDRLATGFVVSQPDGGLVFANRPAREMLAQPAVSAAGLRTLEVGPQTFEISSASIVTHKRSRKPALQRAATASTTVAIFVDPRPSPVPEELLMQLHSLTRAEAATLNALLAGQGLQHAAASLGISPNTVKTHVSRILAKTGAAGQSGLVRMILTGPAMLSWH